MSCFPKSHFWLLIETCLTGKNPNALFLFQFKGLPGAPGLIGLPGTKGEKVITGVGEEQGHWAAILK